MLWRCIEIPPDEIKETEFNSSVATLMRVDQLIKELHSLRRGMIPRDKFGIPIKTGNITELYILTLHDLHIEIAPKMAPEEYTDSKSHEILIDDCKKKWGTNLNIKIISRGLPNREYQNNNFYQGWDEMHKLGDEYFVFLIKIADMHGMLLTNKKEDDDEPDEWDE